MLDPCPGGVVQWDEPYELNVQRELGEEMGIDVSKHPAKFIGTFFYSDSRTRCWGGLFSCEIDVPPSALTLQEEEVEEVSLMTASEILAIADKVMPDGMFAFRKYIQLSASTL